MGGPPLEEGAVDGEPEAHKGSFRAAACLAVQLRHLLLEEVPQLSELHSELTYLAVRFFPEKPLISDIFTLNEMLMGIQRFFSLIDNEAFTSRIINLPVWEGFLEERYQSDFFENLENKLDSIFLWFAVAHHLHNNNASYWHFLDHYIQARKEDNKAGKDFAFILPPALVASIYESKNLQLINQFERRFPRPIPSFFSTVDAPLSIKAAVDAAEKSILNFFSAHKARGLSEEVAEYPIINLQRQFRNRLRQYQEWKRIDHIFEGRKNSEWIKKQIEEANSPYVPQCEPELAQRILEASKKVKLYKTVRHLTALKHIKSIFDEGLYGRKNLTSHYMPFEEATLSGFDVTSGDGNVICLGFDDIHMEPEDNGAIEITFDLDKLRKAKTTAFYKQMDFGYKKEKDRELGIEGIFFDHTSDSDVYPEKWGVATQRIEFSKRQEEGDITLTGIAYVCRHHLISYNLKALDQILTMNFFRFLDAKEISSDWQSLGQKDVDGISEVYHQIQMMNDEQLIEFLTKIGRRASDTGEFNFYGAHRIDFSTVCSFSIVYPYPYTDRKETLVLKDFLRALNRNSIDALGDAERRFPQLFESKRFVAYLQRNILNTKTVVYESLDAIGQRIAEKNKGKTVKP